MRKDKKEVCGTKGAKGVLAMKRRVLILFLSAVLLSGCAGGGRLDSYYNFSGRVYEKGTTHPISGILVKVQPGELVGTTGPTGGYMVEYARGSQVVTPLSAGWIYEPRSHVVDRERHDLDFFATRSARTPVYEDENFEMLFVGCEPASPELSVSGVLVFEIINRTSLTLSLYRPVFALDGVSLNTAVFMEDAAPGSLSRVRLAVFGSLHTMTPTRITGSVDVVDRDSTGDILAQVRFIDVPVIRD